MKKWQYYGLFIDKETHDKLIDVLVDYHWIGTLNDSEKEYLDHCTLLHKAQYDEDSFTDNLIKARLDIALSDNRVKAVLKITHIGISDKAMAFRVSLQDSEFDMCSLTLLCANEIPHITICTFNGGKPVESNNITKWHPLDEPIEIETTLKRV